MYDYCLYGYCMAIVAICVVKRCDKVVQLTNGLIHNFSLHFYLLMSCTIFLNFSSFTLFKEKNCERSPAGHTNSHDLSWRVCFDMRFGVLSANHWKNDDCCKTYLSRIPQSTHNPQKKESLLCEKITVNFQSARYVSFHFRTYLSDFFLFSQWLADRKLLNNAHLVFL